MTGGPTNEANASADDPVDALLKARERLVVQRRQLAASLAGDYQRGHTDDRRSQFIEIQRTLEAIDQAVDDERALGGVETALERTQS